MLQLIQSVMQAPLLGLLWPDVSNGFQDTFEKPSYYMKSNATFDQGPCSTVDKSEDLRARAAWEKVQLHHALAFWF